MHDSPDVFLIRVSGCTGVTLLEVVQLKPDERFWYIVPGGQAVITQRPCESSEYEVGHDFVTQDHYPFTN